MKALDSNVLLRLLLNDDAEQTVIAEELVKLPCWVSLTVLLEVAWVLGSRYRLCREELSAVLRGLMEYRSIEIEARHAALWAIDRFVHGGDIADLLHVAAARDAEAFVTFDNGIARAAGSNPPLPIETFP